MPEGYFPRTIELFAAYQILTRLCESLKYHPLPWVEFREFSTVSDEVGIERNALCIGFTLDEVRRREVLTRIHRQRPR